MVCKLIEEEQSTDSHPLMSFLEECLRHKSDMVMYLHH